MVCTGPRTEIEKNSEAAREGFRQQPDLTKPAPLPAAVWEVRNSRGEVVQQVCNGVVDSVVREGDTIRARVTFPPGADVEKLRDVKPFTLDDAAALKPAPYKAMGPFMCGQCNGIGTLKEPPGLKHVVCERCKGSGQVMRAVFPDRLDTILSERDNTSQRDFKAMHLQQWPTPPAKRIDDERLHFLRARRGKRLDDRLRTGEVEMMIEELVERRRDAEKPTTKFGFTQAQWDGWRDHNKLARCPLDMMGVEDARQMFTYCYNHGTPP